GWRCAGQPFVFPCVARYSVRVKQVAIAACFRRGIGAGRRGTHIACLLPIEASGELALIRFETIALHFTRRPVAIPELENMRKPRKQREPRSSALIKKARETIAETIKIAHERERIWQKFVAYAARADRRVFRAVERPRLSNRTARPPSLGSHPRA